MKKMIIGLMLILSLNKTWAMEKEIEASEVPTEIPEIPLEVLFGSPLKTEYKISPDGNYISYLALGQTPETKNILNIWVKSYDKEDDKQVTFDTKRPIRNYFWSYDNQTLFYVQDKNGDENWSLYSVNKDDIGEQRKLTPFEKVNVKVVEYTQNHPDKMLLAINKEDPSFHDIYLLDITSNTLELVEKNTGTISWAGDSNLNIKAKINVLEDGRSQLLVKNEQGLWEPHFTWDLDDAPDIFDYSAIHCSSHGKIYFTDYADFSTNRLIEYDPVLKQRTILAGDEEFDIKNILWDEKTGDPLAVCFNKLYHEWEVLDPSFKNIYKNLRSLYRGNLDIVAYDREAKKWVVSFNNDNAPLRYYLFDSETNESIYLGTPYPELEKYKLATTTPISFISRDGLKIHGYFTESKAAQPAPLILLVHGGPWLRDSWGYSPVVQVVQLYVNRGYNVLQVNYRGSNGFGKKFEQAGDREWGHKMHDDLLDGIQWLVDQGKADPKQVAIAGGSYDGYSALVGAAFTPDIFRCAIDLCGPSNLETLLRCIPPHWKLFMHKYKRAMGDLETEEGRALLKERSPLYKADQIKIPLLIGQGANDTHVTKLESDEMVEALRKNNVPHIYKVYENEGHGFNHASNRLDFYRSAIAFLGQHMPV